MPKLTEKQSKELGSLFQDALSHYDFGKIRALTNAFDILEIPYELTFGNAHAITAVEIDGTITYLY